jgi:hypothetical protein
MPHRHVFKFKVGVLVTEANREIEFHTLKMESSVILRELFEKAGDVIEDSVDFGNNACEHIATIFGEALRKPNMFGPPINVKFVEVSEDGENGAIVEWEEYAKVHDAAAWAEKMRRITANKLKTSKSKKEGK